MTNQFVVDELIATAQKTTGFEKFDSESYREGLDILVGSLNKNTYPEASAERLQQLLLLALSNRLKVTHYLEGRPELLERPIEKPVFVFGVPRTGTTLLSNLLATDPARRSPLTWEIDEPVPPATSTTLYTDPRAVARLEMEKKMLAAMPEMGKYYRSSAIYPNEDVYIMAHDFKTLMLESRGKMPEYRDWLLSTDMTSAYEYHKRYLQVLQADALGTWNLKMPSHALWIETLLKVYPDARLIWTHRDPLTATGSFCGIIKMGHSGVEGGPDTQYIGQNCLYQATEHANRLMDFRDKFGEDRIIDVHYSELMSDPISAMRKLYGELGDDFTGAAESGMQTWLDDNPQNKFGKHEYKLEQYGLDVTTVKTAFERYSSRYHVESEGV